MGLDTSHGCWNGAYSAFGRWRNAICEVAGLGDLDDYVGFGGHKQWDHSDPLTVLLYHSDCDGEIEHTECSTLADSLEQLLPALERLGDGGGHIGMYVDKTQHFIDGLRHAADSQENVEFH